MLKSQFLLEVSGGGHSDSATVPLRLSAQNLEEPTSAKICAHCMLTVLNTSQRIVSFKVLTNAQNRYSIRPAVGILQPSQSLDIIVGVSRKHASDPPGVILLRYVKLPGDWSLQNDLASFWSNAPKDKVKALKLVQSVFEADSANYSLHSSFSGVSSAHGNGSPMLDADSDSHATPLSTAPASHRQPRTVETHRSRPDAAHQSCEHPSATASEMGLDDAHRTNAVITNSREADVSFPPALSNAGLQIPRVAEVSRIPHGNLESFNSLASFMPVESHQLDHAPVSSADDAGYTAGPRSDSRASTLSDYSHRTDDPALGMDQDMVAAVEKLRAAVSSVKARPKPEMPPFTHRRPRANDPSSSRDSTAAAPLDASSSLPKSANEPSAPPVNGETPTVTKHSRYPPVEACVSSISRVNSADSSLLRLLFPSATLSDLPVYVKMDPHMLQLSEGDSQELLLLLRWKDVVALSVRTDSDVATILLLLNGNSGNVASCFRDIKVCDSLVSDVYHTLHLLSIKGSADTICRMAVHAGRCPGNSLQPLPHVCHFIPLNPCLSSRFSQWLWIAAQCRFPGSAPFRAMLCNAALSLPHVCGRCIVCSHLSAHHLLTSVPLEGSLGHVAANRYLCTCLLDSDI
jgi:hypothetical protein